MLTVIVLAVIFVPVFFMMAVVFLWKQWNDRRRRRSPLTSELLRLPGHSLRDQVDDVSVDLMGALMLAWLAPAALTCLLLAQAVRTGSFGHPSALLVYGAVMAGSFAYFIVKVIRLATKRQRLRDAADAEQATGQELEQLKSVGYRVFHDVQAGKFNLDHVVVGPSGVYAIETKSRLKPRNIMGTQGSTVISDGQRLKFPDWTETRPLEQARRQARWLKERIGAAAGESVSVKPVLALPGWFVERTGTSDVVVLNPKTVAWIAKQPRQLDDGQIKRIEFQLEQLVQIDRKRGEKA